MALAVPSIHMNSAVQPVAVCASLPLLYPPWLS